MRHSIYVISHRPAMVESVIESMKPEPASHFNGAGFPCFSALVNACVQACPTETVIMASDKVHPSAQHVKQMLDLLDEGHGLVALYRFAFFGFRKELFRRIGPMDERFVKGSYEDDDMAHRLLEADISFYQAEAVPYTKMVSEWKGKNQAVAHHKAKWRFGRNRPPIVFTRLLPELPHAYDFGPPVPTTFLPWSRSVLIPGRQWMANATFS